MPPNGKFLRKCGGNKGCLAPCSSFRKARQPSDRYLTPEELTPYEKACEQHHADKQRGKGVGTGPWVDLPAPAESCKH